MVLFDFGAEYCCYCSDVTCSWPVNGKFTDAQKVEFDSIVHVMKLNVKIIMVTLLWPVNGKFTDAQKVGF